MQFPLAHDEAGDPITVPATGAGWLVRRHSGGRGRPAAVYDACGSPLLIALDATAADLRAKECKPGMYRLDVVDVDRRQLGVTAYTEVIATTEETTIPPTVDGVAVTGMVRALEAMQRTQADQIRTQADIIKCMVERLPMASPVMPTAPAPGPAVTAEPVGSVRNMSVQEFIEAKQQMDKFVESVLPEDDGDVEDDEHKSGKDKVINFVGDMAEEFGPLVKMWSHGKIAQLVPSPAPVGSGGNASRQPQQTSKHESHAPDDKHAATKFQKRLMAVMRLLTEEERDLAAQSLKGISDQDDDQLRKVVMNFPPEQVVALFRQRVAATKAAETTAENVASSSNDSDNETKNNAEPETEAAA